MSFHYFSMKYFTKITNNFISAVRAADTGARTEQGYSSATSEANRTDNK